MFLPGSPVGMIFQKSVNRGAPKVKTTARVAFSYPIDVVLMDRYGEHKGFRVQVECVRSDNVDDAIKRFRSVRSSVNAGAESGPMKNKKCLFLNYGIDKIDKKGNKKAYLMKSPTTHLYGFVVEYNEREGK